MAEVIRMPLLSDTMTEGKIVKWNKKVGDKVKSDDVLADVETDKATMEVVGYADGTLLYLGVPEGKAAQVNEIIAIVGKEGEDISGLLSAGQPATTQPVSNSTTQPVSQATTQPAVELSADQKAATVIRMPLLSDTMTEGKIVKWNKNIGDKVKSDDAIADVETDKATMEVVGYADGTLLYIGLKEGEAAKVNEIIAIVGKAGTDVTPLLVEQQGSQATTQPVSQTATQQTADQQPATPNAQPAAETHSNNGRVKASPLAKKHAQEKGIDIAAIAGSGDGGRIIKKDVDNYTPAAKASTSNAQPATSSVKPFTPGGQEGYTDTPLTSMRKTIARRLGESMYTAPHFYLTMTINMDNAMTARTAINEVSPVKVSFQDMLIKACAIALRQHPGVN
ncbi:MAG: biotin/lipoyl-containing protein, partial [Sphingobacteriales bacterium]